jgi:hypothetical protein
MSEHDRHQRSDHDLELELDRAIDALNDERRPDLTLEPADELWSALEAAMALRSVMTSAEPAAGFPRDLAASLVTDLPRRSPNGRVRASHAARPVPGRSQRLHSTFLPMTQAIGACAVAGMLAGFVIGGGGSRLAMRVAGGLFTREHPGVTVITESSDRPVGDISWAGTIDLMMQGMAYGLIGGLFFFIARRWLPRSTRAAGLAYGLLLFLIAGAAIISAGNQDFERIGSPALNVLMFGSLFILFGLAVAPLSAAIGRLAAPSRGRAGIARRAFGWLLAVAGVFGLGVTALTVIGAGMVPVVAAITVGEEPPTLEQAAAMITLAAVACALPLIRLLGGAAEAGLLGVSRLGASRVDAAGRWALRIGLVGGASLIVVQILTILNVI